MCFTIDQIERACGLLLLNEFNAFVYCCKQCQCEYDSGPNLEVHILSEHQDDKGAVFAHDGIFVDNLEPAPTEREPTKVKFEEFEANIEEFDESNVEASIIEEDKPIAALFVNENIDNGNSIATKTTDTEFLSADKAVNEELTKEGPRQTEQLEASNESEENVGQTPLGTSHGEMNPRKRGRPIGSKNVKKYSRGLNVTTGKRCEICNIIPRSSYEYHMKIKHSDNAYNCDICDATFKNYSSYLYHMRKHTGERPFACSVCGKTFNSRHVACEHEMSVHNMNPIKKHKCPHCDKAFYKLITLKVHISSVHTNDRPFKCAICDKDFPVKSQLLIHEPIHGEAKLKCRYCDEMFKIKPARYRHEKAHQKSEQTVTVREELNTEPTTEQPKNDADKDSTEVKKFPCDVCSKVFKQKQGLMKHRANRHKIVEETIRCEICNIIPRRGLERHMRTYHSDHRFKCDYCDVSLTTNMGLKIHMRIHTGENPFLCSICGKAFKSKSHCSMHEKLKHTILHDMVKKHQCPHCDRSFTNGYSLKYHLKAVHTKERPWVCDICGKDFVSKKGLNHHKDSHDGPKYKCRYCDIMFTNTTSRWNHESVYHKNTIMINGKIMNRYKKKHRQQIDMLKEENDNKFASINWEKNKND